MKGQAMLDGCRKIYVASSWRNHLQQGVVHALRAAGHEVYDFKANEGFHWSQIDGDYQNWSLDAYTRSLEHPLAKRGFDSDFKAMQWADTFVLVQPCGRSAHLEFGWAVGAGKKTIIYINEKIEPELMFKMADFIATDFRQLLDLFEVLEPA